MSDSILKSKEWLNEIFYCKNYRKWLQMFIEIVPCVNGNKEIIKTEPGFIKGIFEISFNLMKSRNKIYFDETQIWIGEPDILPINFKPKSRFWINFEQQAKKNKKNKIDDVNGDNGFKIKSENFDKLPPVIRKNGITNLAGNQITNTPDIKFQTKKKKMDIIADKEISLKIQDILISLTSFLRGYLKILTDEFNGYQREKERSNAIKKFGLNSKEVGAILKEYRDNLKKRRKISEILILCFLIVTQISEITYQEKRSYIVEIDEILGNEYWRDSLKISEEIRIWYKKLFLGKEKN